jgi:hypothetical protein
MSAGKVAHERSGKAEIHVLRILGSLGAKIRRDVIIGETPWGARRKIPILCRLGGTLIGIRIITQEGGGSAYLKYYAWEADAKTYPEKITPLIVFSGGGFSSKMRTYMEAHKGVALENLKDYLITWRSNNNARHRAKQ